MSELVLEVCKLLNIKKVNTSGYHPQTDGLVERFNCTLSHMIAKCAQKTGSDWDSHLPFYCLPIEALYKSQLERHHFISYMKEIHVFPLKVFSIIPEALM